MGYPVESQDVGADDDGVVHVNFLPPLFPRQKNAKVFPLQSVGGSGPDDVAAQEAERENVVFEDSLQILLLLLEFDLFEETFPH